MHLQPCSGAPPAADRLHGTRTLRNVDQTHLLLMSLTRLALVLAGVSPIGAAEPLRQLGRGEAQPVSWWSTKAGEGYFSDGKSGCIVIDHELSS